MEKFVYPGRRVSSDIENSGCFDERLGADPVTRWPYDTDIFKVYTCGVNVAEFMRFEADRKPP